MNNVDGFLISATKHKHKYGEKSDNEKDIFIVCCLGSK